MSASFGKKSASFWRLSAATTIRRCRRQSSPSAANTPRSFISSATDSSRRVRRKPCGRWTRMRWMDALSETTAMRCGPMRIWKSGP